MSEPARHIEADKNTGEVVVDIQGPRPPIKPIDGQSIDGGAAIAFTGVGNLPCKDSRGEIELHIGDVANLLIEAKCVGIRVIEDKNGDLMRVHLMRPLDGGESIAFIPFDDSNPHDDGILRYTT
jgi:hypothetical protein